MDVLLLKHSQVLIQPQLMCQPFTLVVAHATFWIISFSQVQKRFLNGNLEHGWVFMLGVHLLMHSTFYWFWTHVPAMFCHNSMWYIMMILLQCHICVRQLFLHIGPHWSAPPPILHNTLNARLGHGSPFLTLISNWVISHRKMQILTLHLLPLFINIMREMGILRELIIQWLKMSEVLQPRAG